MFQRVGAGGGRDRPCPSHQWAQQGQREHGRGGNDCPGTGLAARAGRMAGHGLHGGLKVKA